MYSIKNMNIYDNKIYHDRKILNMKKITTIEYGIINIDLLFLIILYNISLPRYALKYILIIYKNPNLGLKIDNIYYTFKEPVESKDMLGHYHIPYYNKYLINKDGELYNILKNKYHKYNVVKKDKRDKKRRTNGYYVTRAINDNRTRYHTSRHKLKALAFITMPQNSKRLIVNHKDGIPGNDAIHNLEWVTYSGNLIHALNNNLMPNSVKSIVVKNTVTKFIKTYTTSSKAEAELKINIKNRLINNTRRYIDGFVVKKLGDNWPILDNKIFSMGIKVKIKAIHLGTSKIFYANSIMEMSKITGVNTTSITYSCRKFSFFKSKITKGYIFNYNGPII